MAPDLFDGPIDTLAALALVGIGYVLLAWIGYRYLLGRRRRTGGAPVRPPEVPAALPERTPAVRPRVDVRGSVRRHRALIAGLVIGLPIAIGTAYWIAKRTILLPEAGTGKSDDNVDAHLRGVKLEPPQPLPPEVFVTADRPFLAGADRDWSKLDPVFRDRVLATIKASDVRGYPLTLLEGYRSPSRQDFLAEQGGHVTLARAFQSKHQFGLAADLAPVRDGQLVIRETDAWAMAAYRVLGEEAERRGLIWGGRWAMQDLGHIEMK